MKAFKILLIFLLLSGFCYSQQTANEIVLQAAKSKLGTKVWDGICFSLVDYALLCADPSWHKRPIKNKQYCYGKIIKYKDIQPGDIVLYDKCEFKDGLKVKSHISIVYEVFDKNTVFVIEQNTHRTLKQSMVEINYSDINEDDLIKGRLNYFRPYSFE